VKISAIVCTFNRAELAVRCVAALLNQTLPSSDFEIVVVDNGSSDGTKDRLRGEFGNVPGLRIVDEPRPGLARARNTGWHAAQGEILAFLDDDAVADPDWLESIIRGFETATPRPGIVGGKVLPKWEIPLPYWVPAHVVVFLTILDWGPDACVIPEGRSVLGCNMAATQAALAAVGGFNEMLGRRGNKLLSWEDVELQDAVRAAGYSSWYEPSAVVHHLIPAARLTRRWMRKRVYWEGVSLGRRNAMKLGLFSARRFLFAARPLVGLLVLPHDWVALVWDGGAPERFMGACRTMRRMGHLAGLFGLSR
jgi:glycosyltransferase involved in cell wall biosynthesis